MLKFTFHDLYLLVFYLYIQPLFLSTLHSLHYTLQVILSSYIFQLIASLGLFNFLFHSATEICMLFETYYSYLVLKSVLSFFNAQFFVSHFLFSVLFLQTFYSWLFHIFIRSFHLKFLECMSPLFIISGAARSCPTLCNPVDWAHQISLFMGFSRQEHWSGLPFPSLGDIPHPAIESPSPVSPVLAGGFFTN